MAPACSHSPASNKINGKWLDFEAYEHQRMTPACSQSPAYNKINANGKWLDYFSSEAGTWGSEQLLPLNISAMSFKHLYLASSPSLCMGSQQTNQFDEDYSSSLFGEDNLSSSLGR